jgi:hypothetical protein
LINVSAIGSFSLSLRYIGAPEDFGGSVQFTLRTAVAAAGTPPLIRHWENTAPYSLDGDQVTAASVTYVPWEATPGTYTLTVNVWSAPNGNGELIERLELGFAVQTMSPTPSPTAVPPISPYKGFPQVWAQPWCREGYAPIESKDDCDAALAFLGIGRVSGSGVVGGALPACSYVFMNYFWNPYAGESTRSWLGGDAIAYCKAPTNLTGAQVPILAEAETGSLRGQEGNTPSAESSTSTGFVATGVVAPVVVTVVVAVAWITWRVARRRHSTAVSTEMEWDEMQMGESHAI